MCKSRELSKFSEAARVNQILIVLIGVQEQGVEQVFRGCKGQPSFNCFDRCAGAKRGEKACNAHAEIYKYVTRAEIYK